MSATVASVVILGIGALIKGISAASTASKNSADLAAQAEANRLNAYASSLGGMSDSLASLQNALTEWEKLDASNQTNQSIIDTNSEWIANYQKMLAGDRTDTVLGRQLWGLETTESLLREENALLVRQKSLYEQQAKNYLLSSALEKQSAYNTAFDTYTQALKEQSLLNVAASGSGQMEGAYSATQVIQNQKIRAFVGVDMVFNTNGDYTNPDEGSFLAQYTNLRNSIRAQIDANNLQILKAQRSINQSNAAITEAQNNIADWMDEQETTFNTKQVEIEDSQKAIEENMKSLEIWKAQIQTEQTNALTALKSALDSKGSDADVDQIYSFGEQLDTINAGIKDYTGIEASYDATDDIDAWKKAEEERIAAEKEKARLAAEEAAKAQAYDDDDDDDEPVKAEKTQAQKTAERDNEKGKTLTEQIKNTQQAKTNAEVANEKGKAQTEYDKKQLEAQTQQAQEALEKAKEAESKVTSGQSDYWKKETEQKAEKEEEKTTEKEEKEDEDKKKTKTTKKETGANKRVVK